MKLLRAASVILLGLAGLTSPAVLLATPAGAAEGDFCLFDGTKPGVQDAANTCVADAAFIADGQACGTTGLVFNLASGTCQAAGAPVVTPTAPAAPIGFTPDGNAGQVPSGELQPMCTNASPFIGGGMFVVSGTVLCYTGAGRGTQIYAYSENENGSGWNPLDPQAWDSLAMRDLFASDDITAGGTLSVYGGAQIYSLNGRNGVQVNDSGVLVRSADADGTVAGLGLTPGNILASATDGTSTSSIEINGGKGISIYGQIGPDSADRVGVVISGDGQGNAPTPSMGPASWADVLVASKNYNGSYGSAVIVNGFGTTTRVGSSSMVVVQGALDFSTGGGTSTLAGATQAVSGGSSTVMAGAAGRHVVMDDNGRMTVVDGPASESSSSMHITNGYGTTNGVMADERMVAMSGGTSNPTTMVLNDRGVSFSNADGAPVTLSGVGDGSGPFDAANVRQLDGGIASIAALAGIPSPQAGKSNSVGIGMGHHGSGTAIAVGGQSLIGDSLAIKYGASFSYSGGLIDSSTMLGVGMSW